MANGSSKTRKAAKLQLGLSKAQTELLDKATDELRYRMRTLRRSSRSRPTLVWEYFSAHCQRARELGVEDELRALCLQAAGQFANPAMLRAGIRYYRFAK